MNACIGLSLQGKLNGRRIALRPYLAAAAPTEIRSIHQGLTAARRGTSDGLRSCAACKVLHMLVSIVPLHVLCVPVACKPAFVRATDTGWLIWFYCADSLHCSDGLAGAKAQGASRREETGCGPGGESVWMSTLAIMNVHRV